MMQRERKEHDVVGLLVAEEMDVGAMVTNLRVVAAQLARDLDRRGLEIDRVDLHLGADLTRKIDDEAWNITRAGGEIEYPQPVAWLNPAPQKIADESVTAEVAIERAQIAQVGQEFGRDRLRPIHPLRIRRIEPALQNIPREVGCPPRLSSRSAAGRRGTSQLQSMFSRTQTAPIATERSLSALRRIGMTGEGAAFPGCSHARNFCHDSGNCAVSTSLAIRPSNSAWNEVLVP